jgi:hypothetical protein
VKQFVIDGEAVVLGVDGIADFNAPHSGRRNDEVQLYAFECLALDGDDLRELPLSTRKTNLDRLLARRPDGIFVAPFEQGEIGPDLFRAGIARAIALGWRRRFNQVVGAVLWFKRLQTAATTFADVKGFGIRTLLATPFAAQSCWYAVT